MRILLSLIIAQTAFSCSAAFQWPRVNRRFQRNHQLACEEAATALGGYLQYADAFFDLEKDELHERVLGLTGFDLLDQDERLNTICDLEGLTSLSELKTTFDDNGLTFHIWKVLYSYTTAMVRKAKQNTLKSLDNIQWAFNEDTATLDLTYRLLSELEASGITELYPEGRQWIYDHLYNPKLVSEWLPGYSPEPLDASPISDQCNKIAQDGLELWALSIQTMSQWTPDAGDRLAAMIRQWSGLDIHDHQAIHDLSCDILEAAAQEGLYGIYRLLDDRRVFDHLFKTAYIYVQDEIQSMERNFQLISDNWQDGSDVNDVGDVSEAYYLAADAALTLIEKSRDMRLLTLTDDL